MTIVHAEECIVESSKNKRKDPERGKQHNRQNIESEAGIVWGEGVTGAEEDRNEFQHDGLALRTEGASKQGTLKMFSGLEWMCRMILREVANEAVEIAKSMNGTEDWSGSGKRRVAESSSILEKVNLSRVQSCCQSHIEEENNLITRG